MVMYMSPEEENVSIAVLNGRQLKLNIGNWWNCLKGSDHLLNFYDFEVFEKDWLVVIINPHEQSEQAIVNDKKTLKSYYDAHKDQIWIGYNSRNYDQYVLKAILLGFNPKEVSDWIIVKGRKGWEYSSLFNKIQLYNYDCMNKFYSLKQLEGFMGNNMKETGVSFDLKRKLTTEEIAETIKYCRHEV